MTWKKKIIICMLLATMCATLAGCTLTMAVTIPSKIILSGLFDVPDGAVSFTDQERLEKLEEYYNQGLRGDELGNAVNDYFAGSSSSSSAPSATPVPTCKHEWHEEVTKASTCVEKGEMTKTCLNCGEVKTSAIEKVDHDYQPAETVEGTCIEAGKITEKCTVCGDSFTVDTTLGEHVFVREGDKTEATCLEGGYEKQVCSVCGEVNEVTTEALGHDFGTEKEVTTKATCDTEGKEAFVCSRCGEVKDESIIEALGHNEEVVTVKEASFFVDGKEQTVCKDCKEVLSETTLAATGGALRIVLPVGIVVILIGVVVAVVLKKRK